MLASTFEDLNSLRHRETRRTNKFVVKPFAAFDVDGTIFKSSLIEKLVDACTSEGIFPTKPFAEVYMIRRRWQQHNTEATYQEYIRLLVQALVEQIAGVDAAWLDKAIKAMVAQHAVRRYAFPRLLMRHLQATHFIVAISGSPDILVNALLSDLPVDAVYGSTYEVSAGRFSGNAISVGDKAEILRRLVAQGKAGQPGSVAVGDTISDAPMLQYADRAIMFNASKTLLRQGNPRRWIRVNEVKDQITVLEYQAQRHGYGERRLTSLLADFRA